MRNAKLKSSRDKNFPTTQKHPKQKISLLRVFFVERAIFICCRPWKSTPLSLYAARQIFYLNNQYSTKTIITIQSKQPQPELLFWFSGNSSVNFFSFEVILSVWTLVFVLDVLEILSAGWQWRKTSLPMTVCAGICRNLNIPQRFATPESMFANGRDGNRE